MRVLTNARAHTGASTPSSLSVHTRLHWHVGCRQTTAEERKCECTGTTSTGQERRRSNGSKQRAPRGDRWPPARRTPSRLERQEAGRRQDRRGAGSAQNQAWEFEKITSEHVTDLLDEQETFKQSRHRKPSEWETPSLFAPWVRGRWKGKSHAHRHAWSRCDYAHG